METDVARINIATVGDLEQAIKEECTIRAGVGLALVASFTYETHLILIFQSPLP